MEDHWMRMRLLLTPAAALIVLAASSPAAYPSGAGPQLLPNIQTLPPADLVVTIEDGRKRLFLTNELANVQTGPLEVYPRPEDCNGDGDTSNDRTGYQRIFFDSNGDGIFTREIDTTWTRSRAGCFRFHPSHYHWHFQDYARYDLLRLVDGRRVRSHRKISFCIIDSNHRYPDVPGSPDTPFYRSCGPGDTQGVSVGWADIYSIQTPGQYIDITNVPDGDYCVRSTTDPNDRLLETDETDNSGSVAITLQGLEVTILPDPC
jgi:hypothetical protein